MPFTVTGASLTSIAVTNPYASTGLSVQQPFVATGTYSNGTSYDITTQVTWASATPATAIISNTTSRNGFATSVAAGTTNITAALNGVTSPVKVLTVTSATLAFLSTSPAATVTAHIGDTLQYTATGTYSDNSVFNMPNVTWDSDTPATATISNASGSNGLVTPVATGTTVITATLAGITSANSTLTVNAAQLVSISLDLANPAVTTPLKSDNTRSYNVKAHYSDGTTDIQNVAATVDSSDPTHATVALNGTWNATAVNTATSGATVTLTATYSGKTAEATLNTTAVQSIAITPSAVDVAQGASQTFTELATFTDGTTATTTGTWASSNLAAATTSGAVATVPNAAAIDATSNITYTAPNGIVGTGVLTVIAKSLTSLTITPLTPSIPLSDATQQFAATAHYSNATTADVTSSTTWTSNDASVASVSPGVVGLFFLNGIGTATINASYTENSVTKTANTNLTVTP
ncbi:MAG: Ig-like domain-containing protein [Burkholderiales bacterium]|nr:Ig-like domain-containing protein [Burkholderiales bacterium]